MLIISELKEIIETYGFEKVDKIVDALYGLSELWKDKKDLFKYLEFIAFSHEWSKVRIAAILIIAKEYPEQINKIIDYIITNQPKILYYILYYYDQEEFDILNKISYDKKLTKVFKPDLAISTRKNYLNAFLKTRGKIICKSKSKRRK